MSPGTKINIYHFHNGFGGGVFSIIRSLCAYKQHEYINNHIIYTICLEDQPTYKIPVLQNVASEQVFYYSRYWNFNYTCRRLAKLILHSNSVIVAHDWLELGMVSNLGLQYPVVHIVHGNYQYYFDLAFKHHRNVDRFITVSKIIKRKLEQVLSNKDQIITFLKYPAQTYENKSLDFKQLVCTFFVRDLFDETKQFIILPIIHKYLLQKGIEIKWLIAGGGSSEQMIKSIFGVNIQDDSVEYLGLLEEEGINKMLQRSNTMILPSLNEGFPVSVVEAMKQGVVPLVNSWGESMDELLEHANTAFISRQNTASEYADFLEQLAKNPELHKRMSLHAYTRASALFDPKLNTSNYEAVFIDAFNSSKKKIRQKVYGSRLDAKWIPNMITRFYRKFI